MLKRMVLAGLLAMAAVPVLAADTAADRIATTAPASTNDARALAGKQIVAQQKAAAMACSCKHGS